MKKKVFVTGGAGYVGSALVPALLEKKYEVTVYDTYWYGDVFSNIRDPNLRQVKDDIRNFSSLDNACKGQDIFIHLACISNDPSFDLDRDLGKSINFDSFFNILEAAKKNKVERFIYASSSSVYGVKEEKDVTENSLPEPITDYAKYKLECENILHEKANNLPYVIVRPATVCGYSPRLRLDLTVNILTINGLEKEVIKVFGGKQLRPNINIIDMVRVYELLLDSPLSSINNETFNAGYENQSVEDIAKRVQSRLKNYDKKAEIEHLDTSDNRSYHINSDKITKKLGFIPSFTIEDAIDSLILAYKEGKIKDGINNPIYHNIKRMKELNVK